MKKLIEDIDKARLALARAVIRLEGGEFTVDQPLKDIELAREWLLAYREELYSKKQADDMSKWEELLQKLGGTK